MQIKTGYIPHGYLIYSIENGSEQLKGKIPMMLNL